MSAVEAFILNADTTRATLFPKLKAHVASVVFPDRADARADFEALCDSVYKDLKRCTTTTVRGWMKSEEASRYMTEFFRGPLLESLERLLQPHNVSLKRFLGDGDPVDLLLVMFHVDHIYSENGGGPNTAFNFMLQLASLNQSLGDCPPDDPDGRKWTFLPDKCVLL